MVRPVLSPSAGRDNHTEEEADEDKELHEDEGETTYETEGAPAAASPVAVGAHEERLVYRACACVAECRPARLIITVVKEGVTAPLTPPTVIIGIITAAVF